MKRDELIYVSPEEIEAKSFSIIERELTEIYGITPDPLTAPVVKRVIHTTADFRYAESLYFSEGVMDAAVAALREGTAIVTDTGMAMAGIKKQLLSSFGGSVRCYMQDPAVAAEAKARGVTRALVSMEHAAAEDGNVIYAIGNAPTALVALYDLFMEGRIQPRLIVAAPVGFVNVMEAKALMETLPVPLIVSRGRAGGSNVAAAIINALLLLAKEAEKG